MLALFPNETILIIIRRHWYAFVWPLALFAVLMVAPSFVLLLAPQLFPGIFTPALQPVVRFALALYYLGLLTMMLVTWLSYYLDVWIITDHRVIDIEQHGLFHREISEIAVDRIQNVTIEIPGFIPTVLRFGNLKIQTAGEGEFTISEVPECYRAKDLILKHLRQRPGPQDDPRREKA